MAARGKLVERSWKRSDGSAATIDDISAFAIPIIAYKEEYAAWVESRKNLAATAMQNNPTAGSPTNGEQNSQELSHGTGLVETVLSGGASGLVSGVQDVAMEDVDVVAVAEEAVEQDDDDDEAEK
jgi:hypothetical protein